jgi:hypothetical protein
VSLTLEAEHLADSSSLQSEYLDLGCIVDTHVEGTALDVGTLVQDRDHPVAWGQKNCGFRVEIICLLIV